MTHPVRKTRVYQRHSGESLAKAPRKGSFRGAQVSAGNGALAPLTFAHILASTPEGDR